jgi:hypothetical protein
MTTPKRPPRVISDCHPSERTSENRTHIPIIHGFFFFSALRTGVTIGYCPTPTARRRNKRLGRAAPDVRQHRRRRGVRSDPVGVDLPQQRPWAVESFSHHLVYFIWRITSEIC